MDGNNWRPAAQGESNGMDGGDWRALLSPDSRQKTVNKIMETLKKHLPISGPEGLVELRKIAVRFEEKIYTAATSQSDYLRKISMKMLTMEYKSQPAGATNSLPSNSAGGNQNPSDLEHAGTDGEGVGAGLEDATMEQEEYYEDEPHQDAAAYFGVNQ